MALDHKEYLKDHYSNCDFGKAISGVLNWSQKWARYDWNRPSHVELMKIKLLGYQVVMVMKDGKVGAWSPSQCDMNANDWYEIDKGRPK